MRGKKRPSSDRVHALSVAAVDGAQAASDSTGIPRTTIIAWMQRPEFDELRRKSRDEMADNFKVLANLALARLVQRIEQNEVEPRDLAVAMGVATEKMLLIRGDATTRTETRTLSEGLRDDEKQRLRDWIDHLDGAPDPAVEGIPAADQG